VLVEDLGTADYKVDGTGDVREWRHRIQRSAGETSISAVLRGMLGADACCTGDDETATATVHWRISFDVVSDGAWELFVSHGILGAFSIIDEKVALEDGGGSASISPVTATATIDGGAPTSFGFSPAPASKTHALGGGEGTTDTPFSGSALTLLSGSGNAGVVLEFQFSMVAFSDSNLFFPAAGGDEVAIRLGRSDTIENGFTAGQYPSGHAGLGARDPAADGHAVAVIFTPLP